MEFKVGDEITIVNQNGSLNGVQGEIDEVRFVMSENLYFIKNISYRYFTGKELVLRAEHKAKEVIVTECGFCKKESDSSVEFSRYTEFTMLLYGNKLSVSDDYGHEDEWDIKYCPMCGKKVK